MAARITINLKESEVELKNLIQDLRELQNGSNPYYNRSESEIAKMILRKALPEEHRRWIKEG